MQASTRFRAYPERVLVGEFKSPLRIGQSVLEYFKDLYPTFYIILFSNRGVHHGSKMVKIGHTSAGPAEIVKKVREKAKTEIKRLGLSRVDADFDKEMWNEYYDSQYIPARKNLTAQKICYGSYKIPELKNYVNRKENKSLIEFC